MRMLVVGGHTRNIGKSALVVDVIRALPEAAWTAVKITQYGHGVCSVHGEPCDCTPGEHAIAIDEERDRSNRTDTSRFLVAGARRALWMRCQQGHMAEAMPQLREALREAVNVVIESNTLLQFVRPELYLVVLDPRQEDFKETARLLLNRADAFVWRASLPGRPWLGVSPRLLEGRPMFFQAPGEALPGGLVALVRERVLGQ